VFYLFLYIFSLIIISLLRDAHLKPEHEEDESCILVKEIQNHSGETVITPVPMQKEEPAEYGES